MENEYIRPLTQISEFHELLAIQKDIWGVTDIDVVPVHTFKAVSAFLGPKALILGYFIDGKISGYLLAFPTSDPKEVFGGYDRRGRELSAQRNRLQIEFGIQKKNAGSKR